MFCVMVKTNHPPTPHPRIKTKINETKLLFISSFFFFFTLCRTFIYKKQYCIIDTQVRKKKNSGHTKIENTWSVK